MMMMKLGQIWREREREIGFGGYKLGINSVSFWSEEQKRMKNNLFS